MTLERERHGWSRAELARRAKMHAPIVGQLELGKLTPWPAWKRRLAKVLKVPADELFKEVGNE